MPELKISLYEPDDDRRWPKQVGDVLRSNGFRVEERGRFRLDVWQPGTATHVRPGLFSVDGFQFDSSWLSEARSGIRIHPRRFYLEAQEAARPFHAPEYQLVDTKNIRPTPTSRLIAGLVEVAELLTEPGVVRQLEVDPDSVETSLLRRTKGIGRDGACFELAADLWRNLARTKVFLLPENFNIMLIFDDAAITGVASDYRQMLETEWLPALGVDVNSTTIRPARLSAVLPAIKQVQAGDRKGNFTDAVLLVAIDGKPGIPLPAAQQGET